MILDFGTDLESKFGQAEIILGPMASAKSSLALMQTSIYRHFATELNCTVDLFRPNIDTRPEMSRLGIEKDKEFTRVGTAKEILDYTTTAHIGKRRVVFVDEVEFLDSEIITAVNHLIKTGNYVLLSGLADSFRGEPFPFSDYKKTMEDLLRTIPEHNKHTSRLAKCKVCRKTAEYTQRLINGEPAPYYDPLIRIDSEESKAQADKKYDYQPRCKEHFFVPGKDAAKCVAYLIKQNNGLTLDDITDISKTYAKIKPEITLQIVETMIAENQAFYDDKKIYIPPTITVTAQMP